MYLPSLGGLSGAKANDLQYFPNYNPISSEDKGATTIWSESIDTTDGTGEGKGKGEGEASHFRNTTKALSRPQQERGPRQTRLIRIGIILPSSLPEVVPRSLRATVCTSSLASRIHEGILSRGLDGVIVVRLEASFGTVAVNTDM